eukprot:g7466.t1
MGNKSTKVTVAKRELPPESEPTPPVSASTEIPPPSKTELPPLPLDAVQTPPEVKPVEDDPDLMKPPPLLLNTTDSIEENHEVGASLKDSSSVTDENATLMLSKPVTHHQVLFEDPTPVTQTERVRDVDAISIEDEISPAGEEESKLTTDSKTSSMQLEETISVTSSAIRNDEEYMKGIMGTSLAVPDATSNESVIGSVAISEQTIDESLWAENTNSAKVVVKAETIDEKRPSSIDVDLNSEFVSVEFQEVSDGVRMGLTLSPTEKGIQTANSMISDKQSSIELNTPFENVINSPIEGTGNQIIAPPEDSKIESLLTEDKRQEEEASV